MNTRRIRERRHRLVLGACLVVSLALHGLLFGALSLQRPEPAAGLPDRRAEPPVFDVRSIRLVRIEEPPEQVVLEPVVADAPIMPTAPASEEVPDPKAGDAPVAAAGETVASAAGATGGAEAAYDPLLAGMASAETGIPSRLPPSMKLRFGIQRKMLESTRKPINALDPLAAADRAEGEGEEEVSWWRRLGAKFGFGDGSKICVPRPEVIAAYPEEVAEK